jgi:hypothetical protein
MPTPHEIAFLQAQRIPESLVFHSGGLPKRLYKPIMKELEAILVTGATPCAAAGHTIRTRAGHCAQCDTSRIAFQARHSSPGFVYVAVSKRLGLHKVGSCLNVVKRLTALNGCSYGGANDWQVIDQIYSSNAGRTEFDIHALLDPYRSPVRYRRENRWVECRETFRAPSSTVLRAMLSCSASSD